MQHLAILHEPYLTRIIRGEKTIESRWLNRRVAPFNRVATGDTIYLKRAGGPVLAVAHAGEVWQFADLSPRTADAILAQHGAALRLEPASAAQARTRRYVVLIGLQAVRMLDPPLRYVHRDQRGWIVLPAPLNE